MGCVVDHTHSGGSVAVLGQQEVHTHLSSDAGSQFRGRNPQSISVPLLLSYLLCYDHRSFEERLASHSIITAYQPNVPCNDRWDSTYLQISANI